MDYNRLTTTLSACNDLLELRHCFECSFDYHLQPTIPFYRDYLCALRTVVGLGFTAVLADNSSMTRYQAHLQLFLNYGSGDFRHRLQAKALIAQSTAEMMQLAIDCFRCSGYPPYYCIFLDGLEYALRGLLLTKHYPKVRDFLDELKRIIPFR